MTETVTKKVINEERPTIKLIAGKTYVGWEIKFSHDSLAEAIKEVEKADKVLREKFKDINKGGNGTTTY